MNSVSFAAVNAFEREIRYIKHKIAFLSEETDDFTQGRLNQQEIWDLEGVLSYLEGRVKELT